MTNSLESCIKGHAEIHIAYIFVYTKSQNTNIWNISNLSQNRIRGSFKNMLTHSPHFSVSGTVVTWSQRTKTKIPSSSWALVPSKIYILSELEQSEMFQVNPLYTLPMKQSRKHILSRRLLYLLKMWSVYFKIVFNYTFLYMFF